MTNKKRKICVTFEPTITVYHFIETRLITDVNERLGIL